MNITCFACGVDSFCLKVYWILQICNVTAGDWYYFTNDRLDFKKIKWFSAQNANWMNSSDYFFMVVSSEHLYANIAICLLMMMVLKCKDKWLSDSKDHL